MRKILLVGFLVVSFSSFGQGKVSEVYKKTLENWQKSHNRWKLRNFVPLVGLHLLDEGETTFGKSIDNDIPINAVSAPEFVGKIIKEGSSLTFVSGGTNIPKLDGEKKDRLEYTFDEDRNSERLRIGFLTWYIQYVEDDYFLRVIDDRSPLVGNFEPHGYFEANGKFIFKGKYKPYANIKVIELENVIGTSQRHKFSGEVSFEHEGQKYNLAVMKGGFLMFTDETNKAESFPYGRYLRLRIKEDNSVEIDFNYAFNPPRSVSLYTTCEIPPKSNHLPFKVTAGEKYRGDRDSIIREAH